MFRWQRYKLFLVSLHISSLFCCFVLFKDEFRVEILVKGYGCGERFALLAGAEVYEQARRDALFADAAQELAMSALLKGLHISKYSILYDVVDSEFPLEVAVEDQEAFVKNLLPLVDNVYSIYDLTDDDFAQSPDYDQLYTELTGAVAIFIESNGVQ